MEIELELGKIISAYEILEGSAEVPNSIKNLNLKFNGKTALKISLLKLKLKDFVAIAEETRKDLIKDKYGVADDEGNYFVSNENIQNFVSEYNEILNTKHSITFTPLVSDDLDGVEIPLEFSDKLLHFFEL